jgi:predicted acetyltransferase
VNVRPLTPDDLEASHHLSGLAFGYLGGEPSPPPAGLQVGAFDDHGRLLGQALARPYTQWWCGRQVPMSGIAGVAVHPDGRGQGLVRLLMDALVAEASEPVSVLYPTAPGIYRNQGWEVVGSLDDTPVPLAALTGPVPAGVTVRSATSEDLPAIESLYSDRGTQGSGLLTRSGPSFPKGSANLLEIDVVSVAVEANRVTGYVAYDRGRGYRHGGPLRVYDCLTATPTALRALAAGVGSWSAVVDVADWRGGTDDLALVLGASLPAPKSRQPWMLRVLDPVAAVAARGFLRDGQAVFALAGQGYRLEVSGGRGELTPYDGAVGPEVSASGLALLYAGVAAGRLERLGLVSQPVPELEAVFAGPPPEILDYF